MEEIEEHCKYSDQLKNDRGQEFFKISGYIGRIMYDDMRQMYYLACPECKKKVIEEHGGYKCEQCGKIFQQCNTNYTYTAKINDFTGGQFFQFMGESGDNVMGMPASDFRTFKENSTPDQIKDYIAAMSFHEY